ncbi:MAG: PatB family C-S lyase [Proteobacteria bacterium]|nr:PatB family C-S lyase [Pseudomonadota bacterium]MDA1299828.1 PatB family C-S lyase [Pseudomonadota bacterium]
MSQFDEVVDRSGTHTTKWERYRDTNILPMWVADMDFRAPEVVIEAIRRRVEHGLFGYTEPPAELIEIFRGYLDQRFGWTVAAEELMFIPGVVPGLNIACRGLLDPGQSALTATPVYYPFLTAPGNFGHELQRIPVESVNGRYRFPGASLDRACGPGSRLLMLCNPFNPVGRMLDQVELDQIGETVLRHDLLVVSDEIHCELTFDGRRHLPTAVACPELRDRLVTLMAPGKTFNLAGIGGAVAIISNPELRERFARASSGITGQVNLFSYEVMMAAYRDGEPWRRELIAYLESNRDYLAARIEAMVGITMNDVQATYLAWLDVRALGLSDAAGFFERGGVGLSDGSQFGGPGFLRLNFGCPRSQLVEVCDRMAESITRA